MTSTFKINITFYFISIKSYSSPCPTDYSELPHLRLHSLKMFLKIRLTGHFTAQDFFLNIQPFLFYDLFSAEAKKDHNDYDDDNLNKKNKMDEE